MSNTQIKQQEISKANGTHIIEMGIGNVAVVNTGLMVPKVLDIMHSAMDLGGFEDEGHGLYSVVFRDDGLPLPKKDDEFCTWMFYPDSKCAVCNIQDCIELAIATGQNPEKENTECISTFALTWKNIIQGFAHELHHANAYLQDGDKLRTSKEARKEEEAKAVEYAQRMMFQLGKSVDVEIDFTPHINDMILEFLAESIEDIETAPNAKEHLTIWARNQRWMLDNGNVYYDPADPTNDDDTRDMILPTFKQFLHICSGDAEDDPAWNTPTTATQVNASYTISQETSAQGQAGGAAEYVDDDVVPDPEVDQGTTFGGGTTGFQGAEQIANQQPAQQPAQQPMQQQWQMPNNQGTPAQQPAQQNNQQGTTTWQMPTSTNGGNPGVNQEAVYGAQMFPPIQLPSSVDPKQVVYGLYLKIFEHIFMGCAYQPQNPGVAFNAPQNINALVPLDTNEAMFVKNMVIPNGNGGIQTVEVANQIQGKFIDKAGNLPGYELIMQTVDGTQIRRRFFPQNPNKTDSSGALTKSAQTAKNGNAILWIVDPDTKAFNIRVFNGAIQTNNNGQWINA